MGKLLTTEIRILSKLYQSEYRHLMHLAAHVDMSPARVLFAVRDLEKLKLIETHLERPTDADRTYRFTKIKLTPIGRTLAFKCYEIEKLVEDVKTQQQ